ncbi:MAG: hypothetical protein AAF915_15860 [Cyanobacteria bacterium P01_D01_bin.50]
MNTIFLRKSFFSLSLATITLLSGGLSVSAQTEKEITNHQLIAPSKIQDSYENESAGVENFNPGFSDQTSGKSSPLVNPESVVSDTFSQSSQNIAPIPGTTGTSSAALTSQGFPLEIFSSKKFLMGVREYPSLDTQYPQANFKPSISSDIAQADIDFGDSNGGGSNYIGVAGNIGLNGESALGDGNFMVISKVGLTDILSLRPSVVLGDETVILVPVTYDFSLDTSDPFREALPFKPYVGAGLALDTGDDSELSFLVSGGLDVPLTNKLTATAAVNAAFFDETDIGLSVGVGYNFNGF